MPFRWRNQRTSPEPKSSLTPQVTAYVLNNRLVICRMFPGWNTPWKILAEGMDVGTLPAGPLYGAKKSVERRYQHLLRVGRQRRTRAYLDGFRTRDVS